MERSWMWSFRWWWHIHYKGLNYSMWPYGGNSWRSSWWGSCWVVYYVLSWYYVNNHDNLEVAIVLYFFNGYFLQEHFITHNEGHVPGVDEVGAVSVKKKKLFIKGNEAHVTLKMQLPRLRRFCLKSLCEMWMHWRVMGWIVVNISLVKKCCFWGKSIGGCCFRIGELMV